MCDNSTMLVNLDFASSVHFYFYFYLSILYHMPQHLCFNAWYYCLSQASPETQNQWNHSIYHLLSSIYLSIYPLIICYYLKLF